MIRGKVDGVVGLQRGDEGKGRIVDLLAPDYGAIARFNGGPNAGHTILVGGQEIILHQVPSGITYSEKTNVIGNGVLLDPVLLADELTALEQAGISVSRDNLLVSTMAHLILPNHVSLDKLREAGQDRQGSTKRGIAYAAADKARRQGSTLEELRSRPASLRQKIAEGLKAVNHEILLANTGLPSDQQISYHEPQAEADVWMEKARTIIVHLEDTVQWIHDYLRGGKSLLAEGAQAFMLDLEHGMQPFTTSTYTTMTGAQLGLGVSHKNIGNVTGVVKAVKSHVGDGPFVTEINDPEIAARVRGQAGEVDAEIGKTSGRERRIGYLDIPELRRAVWMNGVDQIALNKLDHLRRYGESVLICTAYENVATGRTLHEAPTLAAELENCVPVYEEIPLWEEGVEIHCAKTFNDLPEEAKAIIELLEADLNTPVKYIGIGPERRQIIVR